MSRKILTLVLLHQDSRVLLGMKKRGFGAGRWNGFGGKVEQGETIEDAARREMREEANVELGDIEKVGIHEFEFYDNLGNLLEVHVFRATEFSGEPVETEEMKPQWFDTDAIPFSEMWPDDVHWFPLFLSGKKFRGKFLFGPNDTVQEMDLREFTDLEEHADTLVA